MGKFDAKCDYESLRNARITENKSRMEFLGIHRSVGELNLITSPSRSRKDYTNTSERTKRVRKFEATPLRRSVRLKGKSPDPVAVELTPKGSSGSRGVVVLDAERKQLLSRRCDSKGRGSIYDPVLGICCHFCRQKKLCGEEGCRRCGGRDLNQPCIGKTDCSSCHSANGVLCRACLKVRYGEEMEQVQMKKDWMCPHCIEKKGLNKFWICNSSLCLKKRKMAPTGIAIYKAREQGYKSVAHLLMAELREKTLH